MAILQLSILMKLLLVIYSLLAVAVTAEYGMDNYVTGTTLSTDCIQSANVSVVIADGLLVDYTTGYSVSKTMCPTLQNAEAAGVAHRDVFLYPDPNCGGTRNACDGFSDKQVEALTTYINDNCKSSWTGRIWVVVDNPSWWEDITITGGAKNNKAFFEDTITSVLKYKAQVGVFSTKSYYSSIFGNSSYSYGSSAGALVGYFVESGQASLDDWSTQQFGGWKTPTFKHYSSTSGSGCTKAGLDYAEDYTAGVN